jgi:hypothetical protein
MTTKLQVQALDLFGSCEWAAGRLRLKHVVQATASGHREPEPINFVGLIRLRQHVAA